MDDTRHIDTHLGIVPLVKRAVNQIAHLECDWMECKHLKDTHTHEYNNVREIGIFLISSWGCIREDSKTTTDTIAA